MRPFDRDVEANSQVHPKVIDLLWLLHLKMEEDLSASLKRRVKWPMTGKVLHLSEVSLQFSQKD